MILDTLKTYGLIALTVITLGTSAASYFLWKSNTQLSIDIATLQTELSVSRDLVSLLESNSKIDDESLDLQIKEGVKVDATFGDLSSQLQTLKCQSIVQEKIKYVEKFKDVPKPLGVTDNINAVGQLLQSAACAANSNCVPTGSSPSGL